MIRPSLLETQNIVLEDIYEIGEQADKQTSRLAELKVLKVEQPGPSTSILLQSQSSSTLTGSFCSCLSPRRHLLHAVRPCAREH